MSVALSRRALKNIRIPPPTLTASQVAFVYWEQLKRALRPRRILLNLAFSSFGAIAPTRTFGDPINADEDEGPLELDDLPPDPDCARIVCISDTHNNHHCVPPLPPGDVLVHAGDLSASAPTFLPRPGASTACIQLETFRVLKSAMGCSLSHFC